MQRVLLTLVGAIASLILAMMLVWYSKKTLARTMSSRHILHALKVQGMSGAELANTAKECKSALISPKLVPVMLVQLQKEGLVQLTNNNRYVITTNGLESLKNFDSMSKEFQKIAKIVQKTSAISKYMVTEAIDRIAMISGIDEVTYTSLQNQQKTYEQKEAAVPIYGADKM